MPIHPPSIVYPAFWTNSTDCVVCTPFVWFVYFFWLGMSMMVCVAP